MLGCVFRGLVFTTRGAVCSFIRCLLSLQHNLYSLPRDERVNATARTNILPDKSVLLLGTVVPLLHVNTHTFTRNLHGNSRKAVYRNRGVTFHRQYCKSSRITVPSWKPSATGFRKFKSALHKPFPQVTATLNSRQISLMIYEVNYFTVLWSNHLQFKKDYTSFKCCCRLFSRNIQV